MASYVCFSAYSSTQANQHDRVGGDSWCFLSFGVFGARSEKDTNST